MKKHLKASLINAGITLAFFFLLSNNSEGQSTKGFKKTFGEPLNEFEQKEQAVRLMKNQPVKFLENKGQIMDMDGKPVPFVLFKAEAPGVNLFITEQGLTIQTIKVEEEHEKENDETFSASLSNSFSSQKTGDEVTQIEWERIDIILKGANIKKENIIKEGASVTNFNFFYPHCADGIYGVKQYEKITIKDIYRGIDWVFYNSNSTGFKYDFVVNPGADYTQIELLYKSKTPVKINIKGEIELSTRHGDITENAPVSFLNGKEIKTQFTRNHQKQIEINGDKGFETSISFILPSPLLNLTSPLTIDPKLVWGTMYGGSTSEGFNSLDTDNNGNVLVAGYGGSANFPTKDAGTFFQGTLAYGGVFTWNDVLILKFDNTGILLWATYYGGNGGGGFADGSDYGNSITCDNSGNIFVTGITFSADFPLQDAGTFFQSTYAGGVASDGGDAFILKFNNLGTRLWATYYGGSGADQGNSIACDNSGNVFVTGRTRSDDFPVQDAATFFQGGYAGGVTLSTAFDAFILKFDNFGNSLWATYYGGSKRDVGNSIACDNSGNVFVTGFTSSIDFPTQDTATFFQGVNAGAQDAFILKFDNIGNLLWATYYGGAGNDNGKSIACDNSGNVFVTGGTTSADFPIKDATTFFQGVFAGGWNDAFILKFNNLGIRLWATYYGGGGGDFPEDNDILAIDGCGNVYLSFNTGSTNVPTLNPGSCHYVDNTFGGTGSYASGYGDCFIVLFDNTGNLLWASYIGGDNYDHKINLAVDNNNNLFMGGEFSTYTTSSTLPMLDPAGGAYYDDTPPGGEDSYILKFAPVPATYSQLQVNAGCICDGSASINISCGLPPYSYVWSNGSSTLNITNTTNTVTGLCPGTYTVTATSNCNQSQTATFAITGVVGVTPSITGTTAICIGSNTILTANGGDTYEWSTTATSTAITVSPTIATTYTVTATNAGCTGATTVVVTINPNPTPSITGTTTICNGSSTMLTASGGDTYSWSTTETTTAITVSPTTTTTYTVIANNAGCTGVTTVVVTVNQNPIISVSPSAICAGGTSTLTASGAISYLWSTAETTSAITVSPTITTSYSLTATTAGCSTTASATVIVGSTLVPVITGDTIICNGSSTTLTTAGGTYIWSTTETTSAITISPNTTTTYSVTVTGGSCSGSVSQTVTVNPNPTPGITGTTTICTGSSTTLTASGGDTYSWSTTEITPAITVSPISNTTYTVTATSNAGCTGATTVEVTVNPNPTPSITGTTTICNGNSTILTASGGDTYNWSTTEITTAITVSPTSSTTYYTVVAISNAGCTGAITVSVNVNPTPTPSISGTTAICIGSSTILTASGGDTYNWSTNETTTAITVSPTNATTYTVTADNSGCTGSTTIVVSIVTPPIAIATGSTVCEGETINLTSTGGVTYTWNGPNAFSSALQNPSITNPTIVNSGTYTVTVSNGSCSDTTTALVTVNPTPSTNAGSDVTIAPGSSTTLTATGGATYIWTPTTGLDCNTCASVIATPTATTIYCVQSNIGTCNSSDCITVTVEAPCPNNKDLAVPNAFSPNADGHNDDFCLQGWNTCIETFTIFIYDRWGEKVFESEEANFCWDGMYRGKIMDPAVFVYYIKAIFTNDEKVVKKGNISLIK